MIFTRQCTHVWVGVGFVYIIERKYRWKQPSLVSSLFQSPVKSAGTIPFTMMGFDHNFPCPSPVPMTRAAPCFIPSVKPCEQRSIPYPPSDCFIGNRCVYYSLLKIPRSHCLNSFWKSVPLGFFPPLMFLLSEHAPASSLSLGTRFDISKAH